MITVISWCNDSYKYLAEGLRQDCQRWGYPFHLYDIDQEYPNLVKAWCNHPRIIRQGVIEFGTVLFLDVECRIVRPIPPHWKPPLVSVRRPKQQFWISYNTGTVMADRSCLPWLDAWVRTVERWEMADLPNDAYIYWPNDICDELAFHAAVAALDVSLNTADLEYEDRSSAAEIARGLWLGEQTVIQHPTLHHWPTEQDPYECKKLFYQNFAGNPQEIEAMFAVDRDEISEDGWWFDLTARVYAPLMFRQHPRPWIESSVRLTSAQR